MNAKVFLPMAIIVLSTVGVMAQYPSSQPVAVSQDSLAIIANELSNISRNVQAMNERLKAVVDKSSGPAPSTVSDPRQKIILGIQALTSAEERVIHFQAAQFDLAQQLNDTRAKLSQTELDLRPQRLDRSVAFEGTTETPEIRENRRQKLLADRTNLTTQVQQLQTSLQENGDLLRDAQRFASDLRRQYLPAMNREMTEQ